MPEVGRGMLLGKFMPPHNGHRYLVDFARHYVTEVDVLVCSLPDDPIPGVTREHWMWQIAPELAIHHVTEVVPQEPSEHPDFWDIWRELILDYIHVRPDYVFASEEYGERLAAELDAEFVPVDIGRELVPVSGTAVREDPEACWRYIPEVVRSHYREDYPYLETEPRTPADESIRICVFGPESTGKTTLARNLASYFDTNWVHEYARPLLDPKGGEVDYADISRIARGQSAAENALADQTRGLLFCDTDPLTTTIWSDVMFGEVPDIVEQLAEQHTYDLYLLCDVDVPWVDDEQRYFPEDDERRAFFERCERTLRERGRRYKVISGSWEERLELAVGAVDEVVSQKRTPD